MGQSGTIALKSFQSFQVNDGLLAKVVEAVKAGEKEARSSGNVQSFEVFYRGFRQNIAIGKLYIIPAKVADKLEGFPTALLYGCLVKQFGGGQEMADLISKKIGDTEFDEYSDASMEEIKNRLFKVGDKFETLILFAPEWFNKREYISFHFTKEDVALSDRIRHLVFGAYYDPRLSSAFNSLMTDVSTDKLDVTDITPKLPFPELAESPLKAFPVLHSEYVAGAKTASPRKRLGLTVKNAAAVTQEVLDPPEADVIEALDIAMTRALGGVTVNEAGKEHHNEAAGGGVPRYAAKEKAACESEHGVPAGVTNVGPGTAAHDAKKNPEIKEKKFNADAAKAHESAQEPIGIELNADGTPKRKEASSKKAAQGEIHVANKAQAWLWTCELLGQMSDGMWENASPMDHWKAVDAVAVVGGEPGLVNVYPKRTYGFRRLVEYVGERMLNLGKLAKAYPELEPKSTYGYAAEYIMEAKPAKAMAQHASKQAGIVQETVLFNDRDGANKEYRIQIVESGKGQYDVVYFNGPRGKATSGGKKKNTTPMGLGSAQQMAKQIAAQKIKEGYRDEAEGQNVQKHTDLEIPEHAVKYVEELESATGDDRVEIRAKLDAAPYNQGDLMRDLRQLEHIVNGGSRAANASTKKASAPCDQCNMMSINGVPVHEGGCPNDGARWDEDSQTWIKQRTCRECGNDVDYDDPCCDAPFEEDDNMLVESSNSWNGQIMGSKHASSQKSRDKKAAYERKLEKIRGKVADDDQGSSSVPDNDDILSEVLRDMGQAPLIDLPEDDGNKNPSQPSPGGGISAMPESEKSQEPEQTKAISDSQAQEVPTSLENSATKHEEPGTSAPQEPKQEESAPAEEPKAEEAPAEEAPAEEPKTARQKVASYIKKAAITVAQGEDEQGFHMLVTMNGREYVLRGEPADKFRQEYAAIKKPEAAVNSLVEKYMDALKPYKKQTVPVAPGVSEKAQARDRAEGLADADAYWEGKEKQPNDHKRYMTQHASRKTATVTAAVVGRGDWDLDIVGMFDKTAGEYTFDYTKNADGERHDDVPVSEGKGDNGEQPKSDLSGPAPEAHDVPPQVDSHEASDPTSSASLFSELAHIATAISKKAYVTECPGHTNSKGESAPWCIKQHDTNKILESFPTKAEAVTGLRNMEGHKNGGAKKADAAPVLPGNLKPAESGNVNAMREALETQSEFEVGKPIEEKQEEVEIQNAVSDSGVEQHVPGVGEVESEVVDIPKTEAGEGKQIIINIASKSAAGITNDGGGGSMGGTTIDGHTPLISATGASLHSDSAAGSGPCKACGNATQADQLGINRCYTPGCSEEGLTQDSREHIGAAPAMAPGAAQPRSLNIAELQALPNGQTAQFGEYQVTRQKPNFFTVSQNGAQVMSGKAEQVMKYLPQAAAPQEVVGADQKEGGFDFSPSNVPSQVVQVFYPEIQHELLDYPNANNSPMIEDIDVTQGYDKDIAAAADDAMDTTKISYVSTSPAAGAGIGRDGKTQVLEGAPLRNENDIRGNMFMDEFYQNYDAGPDGSSMSIVSKKVAAADEAAQFTKFLSKVCGEIAAALTAGFKVTSRPLMDKIPGVGEVQLAQVEKAQPGFMPTDGSIVDPASRVKYLLEKLTDSEIQDAINKAYAHAGVWHDEAEGGFVYEVFVRANTIDTDTMVMKYEFVCGTKEAD